MLNISHKAVFLDRDGTLNFDKGYVHKIEDFKLQPFVLEGLTLLQNEGYKLIVISNQSGINRGKFTLQDMAMFNAELLNHLPGIRILKFYFCQHTPEENCDCRKPKTKNLDKAVKEFGLDKSQCWVIGDMTIDAQMAQDAKVRSILIKTGYAGKDKRFKAKPDYVVDNMLKAAEIITGKKFDKPKSNLQRWMH